MGTKPFSDRDSLLAWLDAMEPADRVHVCRLLADNHTRGELAILADDTIYELTRHDRAPVVAEQLGLTLLQVNRAVRSYNARRKVGGGVHSS